MRVGFAFLFFLAALASTASAQAPRTSPPADGLYESWPSATMEPVGPLSAPPPGLPRWIDVRSDGGTTTVTFEPERRVVWRITWGPDGPVEKTIEVDGEPFATSRFEYDVRHHLARKIVTGPGIHNGPHTYGYTTDARGALQTREGPITPAGGSASELRRFVRTRRGLEIRTSLGGREVRVDVHDRSGRRVETRWTSSSGERFALHYVRVGGRIAIERTLREQRQPADASARDPSIRAETMSALIGLPIEVHETQLLLGSAVQTSDDQRGVGRSISLSYAENGCWLNQPSTLIFDGTGLLASSRVDCICGFCVDAALPVDTAPEATLGVDLHWTDGPWVRLVLADGSSLDVTSDHRVITPRGPIAAGVLRAGDEVSAARGGTIRLRSVELLAGGEARLGRNVRTREGTFAAGGVLFESETDQPCPQ